MTMTIYRSPAPATEDDDDDDVAPGPIATAMTISTMTVRQPAKAAEFNATPLIAGGIVGGNRVMGISAPCSIPARSNPLRLAAVNSQAHSNPRLCSFAGRS